MCFCLNTSSPTSRWKRWKQLRRCWRSTSCVLQGSTAPHWRSACLNVWIHWYHGKSFSSRDVWDSCWSWLTSWIWLLRDFLLSWLNLNVCTWNFDRSLFFKSFFVLVPSGKLQSSTSCGTTAVKLIKRIKEARGPVSNPLQVPPPRETPWRRWWDYLLTIFEVWLDKSCQYRESDFNPVIKLDLICMTAINHLHVFIWQTLLSKATY